MYDRKNFVRPKMSRMCLFFVVVLCDGFDLAMLNPKIADHDDSHPVAEDMNIGKDAGLRLWRQTDPYSVRRRTDVDYMFHTKEHYKKRHIRDILGRTKFFLSYISHFYDDNCDKTRYHHRCGGLLLL